MSRVEAAAAMDRLPWLQDEPAMQPVRRRGIGRDWTGAGSWSLLVGGDRLLVRRAERRAAELRLPRHRHARRYGCRRLARPHPCSRR